MTLSKLLKWGNSFSYGRSLIKELLKKYPKTYKRIKLI